MKFGLFQSVQLPNAAEQGRYYKEALEQVLWAEQLGFHSVWFTEHHFSRHGIVSATMPVLSYLAGVTSAIRLGTAVAVLPFHNPVQLAEEAATVDLLSNGRLDLGVGRGYQWGEFHRYNIPMEEANGRFDEALEIITKAWTSTQPFDFQGQFWSYNDMTIHPKPVQQPHPPVSVAASSPASMDRIAQAGRGLVIGQGEGFQQVADQVSYFRSAVGEAGGEFSPDRVTLARAMYTARTEQEARDIPREPFLWFKQTGQEVGAPPDRRVDLLPENFSAYRRRFAAESAFDYDAMLDNVVLFGTPNQIAERVGFLQEAGVGHMILFVNYGGIRNQKVMDSLELFASEVMPQFKD